MYKIRAVVKEVEGVCHAGYRPGHRITFERPRVNLRETDHICMWAFQALLPFVATQSSEIANSYSRVHKQGDSMLTVHAVRCPDPGPTYAGYGGAGSVLFELVREEILPREQSLDEDAGDEES
jgi:uncharacterized repeat protein (TIGR04076 family)